MLSQPPPSPLDWMKLLPGDGNALVPSHVVPLPSRLSSPGSHSSSSRTAWSLLPPCAQSQGCSDTPSPHHEHSSSYRRANNNSNHMLQSCTILSSVIQKVCIDKIPYTTFKSYIQRCRNSKQHYKSVASSYCSQMLFWYHLNPLSIIISKIFG